ncbi:MAG: hypothetical protein ABIP79_02985 [Chitinophagaceae bacterium]
MKKIILLNFLCFLFVAQTAAQNIDSTIDKYANEYAQERAYLHFDKATYGAGETIWFKAYLLEGITPAFSSKTFYIDWTDDKGNLLSQTVSPLQAATTNGQYDIPTSYKGSFIHVKAYTKWMLNFDTAFIYEKDIRIISDKPSPVSAVSIVPSIGFYPEGGDIVLGVNNKVAFKAIDQFGRPVKIKGVVKNQKGELIDSLRTLHDGMGYLFVLPEKGESFAATWKDEKGKEYKTALPVTKEAGISFQLTISGKKRNFLIQTNETAASKFETVYLVGTMNQYRVFKVARKLAGGKSQGFIPVQDLPSGILTITMFDGNWNPLAERITFVNNEEYAFAAEMNVAHWGLNKRARNEIEITVSDSLSADFSVAVTDAAIDTDSTDNIISHLLLSSDLKGQIFNPAYYFTSNDNTIVQHLDLVMLTNGWRRFKWDDVVKGILPKINYPKDTAYLHLSGKVYGVLPSQLRDNANIILVINQKGEGGNKMLFVPVANDGTFKDETAFLFDTVNIYFQLSKGIKDATVRFMESKLPPYKNRVFANGLYYNKLEDTTGYARHFQLSDEVRRLLQTEQGKVLENVIIKAKTKTPVQLLDEKYASGMFVGDGYQFDLVNDPFANSATDIFSYLQGKVAGLQITGSGANATLQWRGGTPLVLIDEIPSDIEFLSSINVNNVAYIKVMRPPFMGASGGANGAIVVYTRKGNDVQNEPGKGLSSSKVSGYSPIKQFYSPNYSSFVVANDHQDLRTTLYWNPQVVTTPEKNKVKLIFYNNDVAKAFRVIIEGMTKDGRLTRIEQIME